MKSVIDILYLAKQHEVEISLSGDQLLVKVDKSRAIDKILFNEIKAHKELIIDFFKINKKDISFNKIEKANRSSSLNIPLSFSQERLWFIDKLEGSKQYHIPAVLNLKGRLNKEALEFALKTIVNRHEVLRTVFIEQEGQAYQQIKDQDQWHLSLTDGSEYKEDDKALQQYIQQLINEPFDLTKDDMLRAALIGLSEEEHVLLVTLHHIASDGWSRSILVNEVVELYAAFEENRPIKLEPLRVQYADYALWQRNYLQGDVLDNKLQYWKDKLQDVEPLQLSTDHQRPAVPTTRGASAGFRIDKEQSEALQRTSQQHGATLFMTLLAAFKVLLYRYTGQKDISVGTPIAGRQQQELEGLIGFFLNTLALRTNINSESSFADLLQQVKTSTLEAYEHQEVPFEKVVDAVVKERDMSRTPLFQVMFVLQNTPEVQQLKLGELLLSAHGIAHEAAKFEITLSITETAQGLVCSFEYNTDLYSRDRIDRMIGHFKELITSIAEAPHQKVASLRMLTKVEEHQLLVEFNDTKSDYPKDKSIIGLFEDQVKKSPEATAVVFEEERLTYAELNARSNQLAHYLRDKGVQQETLVPICIERSLDMMVGILGILKAGGAYVPIDPEYPQERIKYMLEDTGALLVVSSSQSRSKLLVTGTFEAIEIDADWSEISKQPVNNLQTVIAPHQLVYVIYTSGSTGKPKGVMIEHRSVVNLLASIADKVRFASASVFLSVTTYSFDICYLELYMPLIYGGKLIIVSRQTATDGYRLAENISYYRPTHIQGTPSTWQLMLDSEWENREKVKILIGGEAVKEDIKDELTKKGDVWNVYGPTETTIWSAIKQLQTNEKVSIGRAISNTGIYIVDKENGLLPIGAAGEICIGGDGLARGYLNRADLTSEKFIDNPFEDGSRLYKTGDLGKWLSDGNIEYLGRIDEQVKIRGYRIELGEIESVLLQSGLVNQAVVVAKEDKEGNKRLVGYLVAKETFERQAIMSYLYTRLPEYMVPTLWVQLESLPLTPNGKINRKELPDPAATQLLQNEYIAPRNEIEEALVEVWQELLGVDRIGINDDFFHLGGHSLMVIKLVSNIRTRFSLTVPIPALFQFTTISELSNYLEWEQSSFCEEDTTSFEVLKL